MTTRRIVLIALGAGALAVPLAAFAEMQVRARLIGWLGESDSLNAFREGMRELGYNEGRDYQIEPRFGEGDSGRLPALAAELVALKVDLIVALTTPSVLAAHKATSEIPIIANSGDPVGNGFAASLRHPGVNNGAPAPTRQGHAGTVLQSIPNLLIGCKYGRLV